MSIVGESVTESVKKCYSPAMKKQLDLGKHCVETEIRKLYNRKLSECLKKKDINRNDEEEIEALRCALECFDFSALRTCFSELAGGSRNSVFLVKAADGSVMIEINDTPIRPLRRKKVNG